MIKFKNNCPHCLNNSFFKIPSTQFKPEHNMMKSIEENGLFLTAICYSCGMPSFVSIKHPNINIIKELVSKAFNVNASQEEIMLDNDAIVKIYPQPAKPVVSHYYPSKTSEMFFEAQDLFNRKGSPSLILAACGSALESALKEIKELQDFTDLKLIKRIDKALELNIITKPVADWAHILRIGRNYAIHEITATRQDAENYINFLTMLFELVFVLPKTIEEKKH